MTQSNERNNFDGNVEESGSNPAVSQTNQGADEVGEAAGTISGAVAGAMIGAPFGLVGAVIGGVSGGAIGNQMGEGTDGDQHSASENNDVSNNTDSINE